MKKILNDKLINDATYMYTEQHLSTSQIASLLDISITTVQRALKKNNIEIIRGKNNVKGIKVNWTKEEENILKQKYGLIPIEMLYEELNKRHTINAIKSKAQKLKLSTSKFWTEEENELLLKYYSIVPKEEILNMLPNRSENSIVCHAMDLGIKSKQYLEEKYSDEQVNYIINNFGLLSDKEIAEYLDKPVVGVQEQRRKYGLYHINKEYVNYENISKFFRGHIGDWKIKSMENCNFQCVLTGSKNYEIHHLVSFNTIISDAFREMQKYGLDIYSNNIEDYSKNELDQMIQIFKIIHSQYPLGVCIRADLHKLFHNIYGCGNNTIEQWSCFINNYNNVTVNNPIL